MADGGIPGKGERLDDFYRRLAAAPAAADADEAYGQVCDILNAVEDELTGIPFDPARWMTDGRMYPPQADHAYPVPGRPDLRRYRSAGHNTLISNGGAIAIVLTNGVAVFAKPGADGKPI